MKNKKWIFLFIFLCVVTKLVFAEIVDFTTTLETDTKRQVFGKIYTNDVDLNNRKANISDVLIKSNVDVFTPSANYHPSTKKYVDDAISTLSAAKQNHTANLDTFSSVSPSSDVLQLLGASNFAAILTMLQLRTGIDFYSVAGANNAISSALTSLNATNLTSGTVSDARLSANVVLTNFLATTLLNYPTLTVMNNAITNAVSGKQDTLGFTPENVVNKSTNLLSPNDTKYPTVKAVTDALSGKEAANANIQAHISIVSGNPHGTTKSDVGLGNVSNTDTTNPANITTTSSYRFVTDTEKSTWNGKQNALGYTAESTSNKATDLTSPDNTKYPTSLAVSTALSGKQNSLGYTAESTGNKATDLTSPDNTKYPSTLAVSNGLGSKLNTSNPTFTGTLTGPSFNSNLTNGYHRYNVSNTAGPSFTPSKGDRFYYTGDTAWNANTEGWYTYNGSSWTKDGGGVGDVTASSTTTFTNKTYDAAGTGNVLSNVAVSNMAASSLVDAAAALTTDTTDTKIPTWGAVLAKLNDLLVTGNPTIAITTPASAGTWVQSATYISFAGTAFDLQGISAIHWKNGSGGTYVTTNVSGTTSWSVSSITLNEGLNTLYARVTDTDAHTAETSRTINVDTIDPVVNMGADTTHDGSGATCTLTSSMITEANISLVRYRLDSGSWTTWNSPYTDANVSIPADTSNHTVYLEVTDLSGRLVTDNKVYTYQGFACSGTPDFQYTTLDSYGLVGYDHYVNAKVGIQWQGATRNVCSIAFYTSYVGNISAINYEVRIYSLSGSDLGTLLYTSNTVSGSAIANGGWTAFDFGASRQLAQNNFAVVCRTDSSNESTSNYLRINYTFNPNTDMNYVVSPDTGLAPVINDRAVAVRLYSAQ